MCKLTSDTVGLSSVVIVLSLAVAFSAWARASIFRAVSVALSYLAQPVRGAVTKDGQLASASPHAIREFMVAKQREWENKETEKAMATGALPLHKDQGEARKGRTRSMARLWRRKQASIPGV